MNEQQKQLVRKTWKSALVTAGIHVYYGDNTVKMTQLLDEIIGVAAVLTKSKLAMGKLEKAMAHVNAIASLKMTGPVQERKALIEGYEQACRVIEKAPEEAINEKHYKWGVWRLKKRLWEDFKTERVA